VLSCPARHLPAILAARGCHASHDAATLLLATASHAIEWPLDDSAEVVSASNLDGLMAAGGVYGGVTAWDPYVFFAVPEAGLQATATTRLTARIYSSSAADSLSIYYQSDDGRWGLGPTIPIVAGLAEYRLDLTQVAWRESSPQEGSKQWGGVTGRITKFRLDPGNQERRWIAFDHVRLGPNDGTPFEPGVTSLAGAACHARPPRGAGRSGGGSADFGSPWRSPARPAVGTISWRSGCSGRRMSGRPPPCR